MAADRIRTYHQLLEISDDPWSVPLNKLEVERIDSIYTRTEPILVIGTSELSKAPNSELNPESYEAMCKLLAQTSGIELPD